MTSSWYNDIDNGLAASFEDSLSGLGVELSSSAYKMSEAMLALPLFENRTKEEDVLASVADQTNDPVTTGSSLPSSISPLGSNMSPTESIVHISNVGANGNNGNGGRHNQGPNPIIAAAAMAAAAAAAVVTSPNGSVNISQENKRINCEMRGFSYILHAATSPATKVTEETLTYLNQGQPYELTIRYNPAIQIPTSTLYRSIIRVGFHERRMRFMEREHLEYWQQTRPGERLLDIDIPLSYGLREVKVDRNVLNSAEFIWDSQIDCGIYVKVHCISTEFTAKKHGGEKGVPFRLQVDTFSVETGEHVHCASSQIKVFKPKGADRKHKTDREKVERRSITDRDTYKPACDVTWLVDIPLPPSSATSEAQSDVVTSVAVAGGNVSQAQTTNQQSSNNSARAIASVDHNVNAVSPAGLLQPPGQLKQRRSPPSRSDAVDTVSVSPGFSSSNVKNGDGWSSSPSPVSSGSSALAAALNSIGNGRKTSAAASGLSDGWGLAGGKASRSTASRGQGKPSPSRRDSEPAVLSMANVKAALLNGVSTVGNSNLTRSPTSTPPGVKASGSKMNNRIARNSSANNSCSSAQMTQVNGLVGPLSSMVGNGLIMKQEFTSPRPNNNQSSSPVDVQESALLTSAPAELTSYSTNQDVVEWLQQNRFAQYIRVFQNFSGSDILRLSRSDFIEICGVSDGIRLSNALQQKPPRPLLTIFVAQDNEKIFNALFMYRFCLDELKIRLAVLLNSPAERLQQIYLGGPGDIAVVFTDEVVHNLEDKSRYSLHLVTSSSGSNQTVNDNCAPHGLEVLLKPLPT